MNIQKINKNLFLITFYLFALRSVMVSLLGISFSQGLISGLLILFFSIAARRNTILSLFLFFALIPLFHGLKMLGILPDISIVSLCFAGIYIAWLPTHYFHPTKSNEDVTTIEQLIDWLVLVIILSLLTTLLQFPIKVSIYALTYPVTGGQPDRFWCIKAAGIFLQGLAFFRIYLLESRKAKINLQKYFLYALFIHIFLIFAFALLQICADVPVTFRSKLGQIHSPFDDIHSLGSILVMYFFVISGFAPSLARKKQLWLAMAILIGIILLILSSGSTTSFVALVLCLVISVGFLAGRKRLFICAIIVATSFFYYNTHPKLLSKIKNPKIHRVARRLLLVDPVKGSVTARLKFADRALGIVASYPISGSGIGSFWRVSRDYHFFASKPHAIKIENAHNYYLQLAANAGLPALTFFLTIFYLFFSAGLKKIRQSDILADEINLQRGFLLGIGGYLISMLAGHPLLLPVQQFCFWMILAQATSHQNHKTPLTLPSHHRLKFILSILLLVILVGGSFYRIQNSPTSSDYGYGDYPFENWAGEKGRWIGKYFATRKFATSNILSLLVRVNPCNIDKEKGLKLTLSVNNNEIDQRYFFSAGEFPLYYYLPGIKGKEITIKTELSKTFNPSKVSSSSDRRDLGIGLEPITFLYITPADDLGFYNRETVSAPPFLEFKNTPSVQGRWTGRRASINLTRFNKKHLQIYYKSDHPNIEKDPVTVVFYADNQQKFQETCIDNEWHQITFDPQELTDHKLLTISINRTWNPKASGISEDTRNLGLFLVTLPES